MIGLLLMAALLFAEPIGPRLPPVEQCEAVPGFAAFRTELRAIIARQDEAALLKLLSDDVEVNFGGDRGPELFASNWKFAGSETSHVWKELATALERGCVPTGDALLAPSLDVQLPEELDPFETWIALPKAVLRQRPSDRAPAIAELDWELLTTSSDFTDPNWLDVKLVDGRRGFVRLDQVASPLGYRLVFEKRGGRWLITAFVAGD